MIKISSHWVFISAYCCRRALNCSCDWFRGWGFGLFRGVDGKGDGPEAVVMRSLGMVEQYLPGLPELEALHIELVEQVGVVGYLEERPQLGVGSRAPQGFDSVDLHSFTS